MVRQQETIKKTGVDTRDRIYRKGLEEMAKAKGETVFKTMCDMIKNASKQDREEFGITDDVNIPKEVQKFLKETE